MSADNAAQPSASVNEANVSDATPSVAQPAAQEATPATQPERSSLSGVALALGLPADITQQIKEAGKPPEAPAVAPAAETLPAEPPTDTPPATVEAEEEEQHEDGSPFKDPRVQERLGKNARQKRELKEENEALKAERDELKAKQEAAATAPLPGPQAPAAKGLLGNVTNEDQLNQWEEHATAQIEWCDANPDGITVGEGAAARFIEPEEMTKYRKDMEKVLLQAPKRRQQIRDSLGQHVAQLQRFNAQAQEKYPSLWDTKSEEHKALSRIGTEDAAIQALLRDIPQITAHPAVNLILSRYVSGYQAEQSGNVVKPKNPDLPESLVRKHPPIAPVTAGPPTRSAAPNASKRTAEAMQNVVKDGGSRESMIAAIRAAREAGAFANKNSRQLAEV